MAAQRGDNDHQKLPASAFLVLGFIARLGEMTPYDLKRAVSQSIAFFWDFPHSQLYVEPERLARLGLLTERQEQHGRRRRLFCITDAGRAALREWLHSPTREQTEIRDLGLLKLSFSGLTGSEHIRQLASEQIELHRQRLDTYEAMAADLDRYPALRPHQVPIRMGFLHEQAWIDFWQSVIDDPPAADPAAGALEDRPAPPKRRAVKAAGRR